MNKKEVNINLLVVLSLLGAMLWNLDAPTGLKPDAWHILVVFLMTIIGIITSAMPMGAITIASITILVVSKTLTLPQALSGFSSPIAWLVLSAFFVARGFIKTNLGKRIAYILITRFGKNNIGLSYSLIFTEFLLSPMIPSTVARGGGIIYPIAHSLALEYEKGEKKSPNNSKWLIATSFHTNVVCCALFLTAMSGNLLIERLAASVGVEITWAKWALAAIVPGIVNLICLPHLTAFLIKPESGNNAQIIENAKLALKERGGLNRSELTMLVVFALMLGLWIFGPNFGIDATTSAFIGLLILVIEKVVSWNDIVAEKTAWETFIWFSILLMLSDFLAKHGVDKWLESNIRHFTHGVNAPVAIVLLTIFYFYVHYFFASITARITVMYAMFILIFMDLGVPGFLAGIFLAIISNISAGLTHYGISSASVYFGSGYFTIKEWLRTGIVIASFNFILWIVVGGLWWKILGWW